MKKNNFLYWLVIIFIITIFSSSYAGFNPMGDYINSTGKEGYCFFGMCGTSNSTLVKSTWLECNNNDIASHSIFTLLAHRGEIYVGTWNGGYLLNRFQKLQRYALTELHGLSHEKVLTLQENGSEVYAGTRDSGVFKWSNNKSKWIKIDPGFNESVLTLYSNKNTNYLYAGTNGGKIYRLDSRSKKWLPIVNLPNKKIYALSQDSKNFLYVGSDNGEIIKVDLTKDDTKNIHKCQIIGIISSPNKVKTPVFSLLHIDSNFYVGSYGAGVFKGIEKSDGLFEWQDTGLEDKYVYVLIPDEYNSFLFAGTVNGVYKFERGLTGSNQPDWHNINLMPFSRRVLSLAITVKKQAIDSDEISKVYTLYAGTDTGELYSLDVRKEPTSDKLSHDSTMMPFDLSSNEAKDKENSEYFDYITPTRNHNGILYVHSDGQMYLGRNDGLFKTKDGVKWTEVKLSFDINFLSSLCSYENNLYIGTSDGRIFKVMEDREESVSFAPLMSGRDITVTDEIISKKEGKTVSLFIFEGDLYAGVISNGIFKLNKTTNQFEKDDFYASDNFLLYANKNTLFVRGAGGIRRVHSTESFGGKFNSTVDRIMQNNAVYVDDNDFYVGTSQGIYITRNDSNYIRPSRELADQFVTALCKHANYLYAGTKYYGVFRKKEGSKDEWQPIGLNYEHITTMVSYKGKLYIGTEGGRIFESSGMIEKWEKIGLSGQEIKKLHLLNQEMYATTKSGTLAKVQDGSILPGTIEGGNRYTYTHLSNLYTLTNDNKIKRFYDKGDYIDYEIEASFAGAAFIKYNGNFYASTQSDIFKLDTNDNSNSQWIKTNLNHEAIDFIFENGYLYALTKENNIYKTLDGGSWDKVVDTTDNIYTLHFYYDDTPRSLYIGTSTGVKKFSSNQVWDSILLGHHVKALYSGYYEKDSALYMGTKDGRIFVTRNQGENLTPIVQFNAGITTFKGLGTELFVGTEDGVYKRIEE